MKKALALLLALAFVLLPLVGCAGDETSTTTTPTTTTTPAPPVQEQPNPVSDFEYGESIRGGIIITRYIGSDHSVVIPDTIDGTPVTVIGMHAFGREHPVETVWLPDSIEFIYDKAFYACGTLTEIRFGKNLKTIDEKAFWECKSLQRLDLSNTALTEIGKEAFYGCEGITEVLFGEHVTKIKYAAFMNCISLQELILPPKLVALEALAFSGCTWLRSVTIPKTLTQWSGGTFVSTFSLRTIILEEGLKKIPDHAFYRCLSLKMVTIPASVEEIADSAFDREDFGLLEVTFLGDAPTTIGERPFGGDPYLDIVYNPDTSGWDTTPLKDLYQLKTFSDYN